MTDAPKPSELLQAPGTPSKPRSVYITIERQYRHGQTPGCLGCRAPYGENGPHSNECKRRFREIIYGEKVEKPEDQDVRVAPPPESRGIAREAPPTSADDPQEVPPMVLDHEGEVDVNMNPSAGFIGGLPTLHEADFICSVVVDSSNYENIYDEKTGEYLEPEEVKNGVESELNQMQDFQVKVDITPSEAREKQLKIVRSR